ncbi:GAD-like domain-containing protein [Mycobacterium sp. URHD0025]|uniref:DUF7161 family protein n=1 Tax=Mycobacterium sp. URHD0025 TaxID=1298864 RepID=UPI00041B4530|nr:GAD-like domain-containing protein [Mycobacterium sp. URHD0025]
MSVDTEDFVRAWGAPMCSQAPAPERFDQFQNVVPDLLLTFWREFGFAGFGNGLLWLCDPVVWQPAVDAWTRGLELEMGTDRWVAVCRSAFGRMQLWGQRTGMSLTITPYRGSVWPTDRSDRMATGDDRDDQIYAALMGADRAGLDVVGDDGQPLFDEIVGRHGIVGPTSMYGFVPVPALGGALRSDRVEIVDAVVHLQVLSDIVPRHVGDDMRQAPRWRMLQVDQTGLAGMTAKLVTNTPTNDAGWPADLPEGTTEVVIVDDTPGPLLTLRVHPVGEPSGGVHVRFDQLAVRTR